MASRPLPDIQEGLRTTPDHSRPLPDLWEGLSTTPKPPGGPPNHSWTSDKAPRPLPDIQEGLPTTPDLQ